MKQFKHEKVRIELISGHHRRMAKGAVGLLHHAREVSLCNSISHKGADHLDRDLGVGLSGKTLNRGAVERRPAFRDVEGRRRRARPASVAFDKIEWGSLAPRREHNHVDFVWFYDLVSPYSQPHSSLVQALSQETLFPPKKTAREPDDIDPGERQREPETR